MTEAPLFLDSINSLAGFRAAWVPRLAGIDVAFDRDEAMRQLRPAHEARVREFSGGECSSKECEWWRAEQVHGVGVASVPGSRVILASDGLPVVPEVDGLITRKAGVVLSIYVADCGVIWLADPKTGGMGLLHSGKKGTEGNILHAAVEKMGREYGSQPSDIVAVLGPCIRLPDYEVDFAAEIGRQADRVGLASFADCGENTAADLERHYSYRKEMGKTGRMMALLTRDFSA